MFVKDVGKRALHTLWQTFSAAEATVFTASGLGVANFTDLTIWDKVATGSVAAGAAAVLSTLKSLGVTAAAASSIEHPHTDPTPDPLPDPTPDPTPDPVAEPVDQALAPVPATPDSGTAHSDTATVATPLTAAEIAAGLGD